MYRLLCLLLLTQMLVMDTTDARFRGFRRRGGHRNKVYKMRGGNWLLFTIRANSGVKPLAAYDHGYMYNHIPSNPHVYPNVYRSPLIDNLRSAVRRSGRRYIVTEMQRHGRTVAQVVFRASGYINKVNWFSPHRMVYSYPYTLRHVPGYNIFSIRGIDRQMSHTNTRRFAISFNFGGCDIDRGFWFIIEERDGCSWGRKDWIRTPSMLYNPHYGTTMNSGVRSADRFLVYLSK